MTAARFECPRCQTVFVKDTTGEAAFVECPSCGALALPTGDATDGDHLARAMSGTHGTLGLVTQADQPPLNSDPGMSEPGAVPSTGPGIFSGLLVRDPSGPSAPAPGPVLSDPSLDFDFTKDLDLELPTDPARAAPSARPPRPARAEAPPARTATGGVHALPAEALASLAGTDDEVTGGKAPWGGFSDEAFGDLEKAFDEMALRPQPRARGKGGLSPDEAAFLRGSGSDTDPGGEPREPGPGARRAAPPLRPPPRRTTKPARARPSHLTLSDEAKRLAFLPARTEAPPRRRSEDFDAAQPEPALERRLEAVRTVGPSPETTELVREKRAPRAPVPSPFAGLTFVRVAAVVLFATVLGAAGGFVLTPAPAPANTPRARAELKLADGNKFYDEGRYDDALGKFREAANTDGTFAPAHRAKGAALAKLQRFDEAAESYARYLDLEPSALDAADAKEAIKRREKQP